MNKGTLVTFADVAHSESCAGVNGIIFYWQPPPLEHMTTIRRLTN